MPPPSLEQYRGSLEEYNAHLEQYRLKVEEQRANGALDLPTYRQNMNQYYEGLQRYQDGIKAYKESAGGAAVTQRHDPKASEEQAAAVTRHIAVVQSQASTRLAQLRLVSPPPSAPPIGPAYDFGQVRGALADAKRQTLAGLDGPDLEAMRLYVDQRFPTGEQLSVERFEWNPGGVVRADSVRALTGDVDRVYESLKALKGISVDLRITSRPTEASVTVAAITKKLSATTDSTMSLFRGLYRYTVVKPGFKTVTGELDLVNDSRGLDCILNRDGQPDGPLPCNRR